MKLQTAKQALSKYESAQLYDRLHRYDDATGARQLTLPNNQSVRIVSPMGRGKTAKIWSVESIATNQLYVMKYSEGRAFCEGTAWSEYQTLRKLYQFDPSLHVAWIHPSLSFYVSSGRDEAHSFCFFFVRQIQNVITMKQLQIQIFRDKFKRSLTDSQIKSFVDIDGSVLEFVLRCYGDIFLILRALSALGFHYNDMNWATSSSQKQITHAFSLTLARSLFWIKTTSLNPARRPT